MLGDLQADTFGQVEDLAPLDADHDGLSQVCAAAGARALGPVLNLMVGAGDLPQRGALLAFRAPRPRPDFPRRDFGAGFARPSDDGGLDEFAEFWPSRAVRSVTWPSSTAIRSRAAASSARVCASLLRNSTTNGASSA